MKKYFLIILFFVFILHLNFLFAENKSTHFYVFISKQCEKCQDIMDVYITPLAENYPVEYKIFDLSKKENFEYFLKFSSKSNFESNESIFVLIGNQFLGEKEIMNNLKTIVIRYNSQGGINYPCLNEEYSSLKIIQNFLKQHTWLGIFLAGLMDGINPCAMSALIFFISYLIVLKMSKRDILVIGITFILVTFFAYFIIGLGLFELLKKIIFLKFFSKSLYLIVGVLLLILSAISFYDFVIYYFTGKADKIILKLSSVQQSFIHNFIRKNIKSGNIVLFSICLAVFLSLTEFTCTGQVYLPTICYAIKLNVVPLKTFLLLTAYNIGFIIPLIVSFILVFKGYNERFFIKISKKSLAFTKLVMAIFFLILGIYFI